MPAKIPTATLTPAHGAVAVELVVNSPVWASYRIDLLDSARKPIRKIGEGYNSDNIPDRYVLKESPAKLDGCHIAFTAALVPYVKGDTVPYSVALIISQEKSGTVPGGLLQDNGQLSEPKYAGAITQLAVA